LANGLNLQPNPLLQAGRKGHGSKIRVNPDAQWNAMLRGLLLQTTIFKDMSLNNVTPGKNIPETFNVVIEIPMNSDPIKYEVDKESGAIFVDRFMTTAMHYPTNYGYVPQTLSGDGDPVDVLVITPYPLHPGVVVPCRPLGILMMEDEAGVDGKVIAVPTSKILPMYDHWKSIDDVNAMRRNAIAHFFEHYKDLEKGKWVKVIGWEGIDSAKKEVMDGAANYQKSLA
jgi:inorganic pyrophosphatase